MLEKELNLLEELDSISKIHSLKRENIDHIMVDFAKSILPTLRIERMNVWLFNSAQTALISIGEYDTRTEKFKKNSILEQASCPIYFEGLRKNEVIIAEDIYTHSVTKELNEFYSRPNQICSLLDIPLRVCGELIGVICFEKTDTIKIFQSNEQSFCFSISFVLASALESRHRRIAQNKLEEALREKEMLMKELSHRVKNNFSILLGLMRISADKAKASETKDVLMEYERRIFSMLKLYDLLSTNENFEAINLSEYLKILVNEFCVTYPHFNHCINTKIEANRFVLSSKVIFNLGLIISEILLNSIKHLAAANANCQILIEVKEISTNNVQITVGDNGIGFDFAKELEKDTLGLQLISALVNSIDIKANYPSINNGYYVFELKV